jgi:adenine/guanine phosphoribosyltransferase-like PRPP-binding protein
MRPVRSFGFPQLAEIGARIAGDPRLADLVQLGLRDNPRRTHLLVSTVLGKHLPADPRLVRSAGSELGRAVRPLAPRPALVIGYAETATALGQCVAEVLHADYLHTTRRRVATAPVLAGFEEEHSHAVGHLLQPADPAWLERDAPVVLVDDELSTGRTAVNTIAALQRLHRRRRYVVAALVDVRPEADRAEMTRAVAALGARLDVVSLASGRVEFESDFTARAAALLAQPAPAPQQARPGPCARLPVSWPADLPEAGRHGLPARDFPAMRTAAARVAAALCSRLAGTAVLVLGTEELMAAPLHIAEALTHVVDVRLSATTRSPVHVLDVDGYPVRNRLVFRPPDRDGIAFAYNVAAPGRFSDIVLVVDDVMDSDRLEDDDGLVAVLRRTGAAVHLVCLPAAAPLPPARTGPAFGSYRADEVAWLLTDLSGSRLEAPAVDREEAIQSGRAHYSESLPIEYQPSGEYLTLYRAALRRSAARVATAVGTVAELILAERGSGVVLASLARAGTPIGILMRRWLWHAHGLEVPHYAVSIVRGRGIDRVALRYLASRHDPADVVFVDGWTGKGSIVRELTSTLEAGGPAFRPDLAVLADPGSCTSLFGTRDDFLIPSACLNSTVSGLVSRTVVNRELLLPGAFHGAKYYAELAAADLSNDFLDRISACFADVRASVARVLRERQELDPTPTWDGWAAVERIGFEYGIADVNLIKPGVGETTRVLLRRVPDRVLIRGDDEDLAHVLLLAAQRGAPVERVLDLPYRCVGIVRPHP